jgi:hypothetical protein
MGALLGIGVLAGILYWMLKPKHYRPTPEQEAAMYVDLGGGYRAYSPAMQGSVLRMLGFMNIAPDALAGAVDVFLVRPTETGEMAPGGTSALQAIIAAWQAGIDVWASPNIHIPEKGLRRELWFRRADEPPPPQKVVRLIAAAEPWPAS